MIDRGRGKGSIGMGFQFSFSIIYAGTDVDMVGEYDLSGVMLGFRQGLGKGWSRVPYRKRTENLRRRLIG